MLIHKSHVLEQGVETSLKGQAKKRNSKKLAVSYTTSAVMRKAWKIQVQIFQAFLVTTSEALKTARITHFKLYYFVVRLSSFRRKGTKPTKKPSLIRLVLRKTVTRCLAYCPYCGLRSPTVSKTEGKVYPNADPLAIYVYIYIPIYLNLMESWGSRKRISIGWGLNVNANK